MDDEEQPLKKDIGKALNETIGDMKQSKE